MLEREREIEIEQIIVEVLCDLDIKTYPISITNLANQLGIKFVSYSSLSIEEKALAKAASDDAFHVRTHDFMNTRIVVDDSMGAYFNRSRFSGGHEIGHIILEHTEDTPNREAEANYFSGYLLAPHPLVLKCKPGWSISDVFGVSDSCAYIAKAQAVARKSENSPWRAHEQWILDNAQWKEGGLLGSI